jgi:hypothetical protein
VGKMINACRILAGIREGNRSCESLSCIWEADLKMNVGETGGKVVGGINLTLERK